MRTGRVTGRKTGKNRDGVDVTRLLQTVVSDKDDVQTIQLVSQTGEESNPPDGSLVVLAEIGQSLRVAVATADFIEPIMGVGGKRVYSTSKEGTEVKAFLKLDPDGTITLSNPGSTTTISPAGEVNIEADGQTIITSAKTIINNAVDIIGDVAITGNLSVTGTITAIISVISALISGTTEVLFGGKPSSTHVHSGVETGPSNTGGPV